MLLKKIKHLWFILIVIIFFTACSSPPYFISENYSQLNLNKIGVVLLQNQKLIDFYRFSLFSVDTLGLGQLNRMTNFIEYFKSKLSSRNKNYRFYSINIEDNELIKRIKENIDNGENDNAKFDFLKDFFVKNGEKLDAILLCDLSGKIIDENSTALFGLSSSSLNTAEVDLRLILVNNSFDKVW